MLFEEVFIGRQVSVCGEFMHNIHKRHVDKISQLKTHNFISHRNASTNTGLCPSSEPEDSSADHCPLLLKQRKWLSDD